MGVILFTSLTKRMAGWFYRLDSTEEKKKIWVGGNRQVHKQDMNHLIYKNIP